MRKLISTVEHAAKNVRTFAAEVSKSPDLQSKLGHVHAWYALRLSDGRWAFGPSKFVGYQDNTAKGYLRTYQTNADGRETERVLRDLSAEVDPASRLGRELADALENFLSQWGRRARRDYRIRLISEKPESDIQKPANEAALLGRISSDPEICGGRPCIKGTRMRVVDIVEAIASGATVEKILQDFDYLTAEDIAGALLYAAHAVDHRVVQTA